MIEGAEPRHYRLANLRRAYLVPERFHLPLHPAHEAVDAGRVDVALAAGMTDCAGKLVSVERLALAVLLDDREVAELDALEGREPSTTSFALTPAADGGAIFARAAVLNLAVFMGTEGAAHQ
jgi:hypothetical protein